MSTIIPSLSSRNLRRLIRERRPGPSDSSSVCRLLSWDDSGRHDGQGTRPWSWRIVCSDADMNGELKWYSGTSVVGEGRSTTRRDGGRDRLRRNDVGLTLSVGVLLLGEPVAKRRWRYMVPDSVSLLFLHHQERKLLKCQITLPVYLGELRVTVNLIDVRWTQVKWVEVRSPTSLYFVRVDLCSSWFLLATNESGSSPSSRCFGI